MRLPSFITRGELAGTESELIARRESIVESRRHIWRHNDTSENRTKYYSACSEAAHALFEHRHHRPIAYSPEEGAGDQT